MAINKEEWKIQKVKELKKLKKISNDQQLLILLFEKSQLTTKEKKQLDILFKIEKHNENLEKAIKEKKILDNIDKKKKRKERDRNLYLTAAMLIDCGLVDTKTGKIKYDFHLIRGGLMAMAHTIQSNSQALEKWKEKSLNLG